MSGNSRNKRKFQRAVERVASKNTHWLEYGLGGLALLCEALAVIFGILPLELGAAILFLLAVSGYVQQWRGKLSKGRNIAFHFIVFAVLCFLTVGGPYYLRRSFASAIVSPTTESSRLVGQVISLRFEPEFARFYQHPPVYFHPINTELYFTMTNQLGKPLYVQNYFVAVLIDGRWEPFENLPALGLESDEIGFLGAKTISRIDLSQEGFDYMMRKGPLGSGNEIHAFMFFNSRLSQSQQTKIEKIRFQIMDSTKEWHTFYSDPNM
jgi:hypothetical protein